MHSLCYSDASARSRGESVPRARCTINRTSTVIVIPLSECDTGRSIVEGQHFSIQLDNTQLVRFLGEEPDTPDLLPENRTQLSMISFCLYNRIRFIASTPVKTRSRSLTIHCSRVFPNVIFKICKASPMPHIQ